MAVAGNWIGAAGRVNSNFGPQYARGDLDRGDLWNGNALVVAPKEAGFDPTHPLRRNNYTCWEDQIALRPSASRKSFGRRCRRFRR